MKIDLFDYQERIDYLIEDVQEVLPLLAVLAVSALYVWVTQ